jgi:hypothetical protein
MPVGNTSLKQFLPEHVRQFEKREQLSGFNIKCFPISQGRGVENQQIALYVPFKDVEECGHFFKRVIAIPRRLQWNYARMQSQCFDPAQHGWAV